MSDKTPAADWLAPVIDVADLMPEPLPSYAARKIAADILEHLHDLLHMPTPEGQAYRDALGLRLDRRVERCECEEVLEHETRVASEWSHTFPPREASTARRFEARGDRVREIYPNGGRGPWQQVTGEIRFSLAARELRMVEQEAKLATADLDETARAVLDHHRAHWNSAVAVCHGCDQRTHYDDTTWPCSTVRLIAERAGIYLEDR